MSDKLGTPLATGATRLSDDEQEAARQHWRKIQREMQPTLDEYDQARRRALEGMHTHVVGGGA